jgi:hypothetical protein
LSYLPEAGQYSCFFVYLKLIVGFSQEQVAYFIAYVGILSCIAQAAVLIVLIKYFGSKQSIIIGLTFQVLQLAAYAFAAQQWLIWFSGLLAAISSIGYPAISAFISNKSTAEQQGVSQGCVTGIRGLCNGIGPAMYGFIFWIFNVNLNDLHSGADGHTNAGSGDGTKPHDDHKSTYASTHLLPGPPFLFGSVLALAAILIIWLIPSEKAKSSILISSKARQDKEKTVVKIGNTSNTYNRSSSTSSMNITAATGLLSAEHDDEEQIQSLDNNNISQELEPFLLNESQTKSSANLLQSTSPNNFNSNFSSTSSGILMPTNLALNLNNNLTNNYIQNQETGGTTSYFTNSSSLSNAAFTGEGSISSYNEYVALKSVSKYPASTNINISETNRMNTKSNTPLSSSPSQNATFSLQFDTANTAINVSKSLKSLDMSTSKFFNSSHKTNVD